MQRGGGGVTRLKISEAREPRFFEVEIAPLRAQLFRPQLPPADFVIQDFQNRRECRAVQNHNFRGYCLSES